MPLVRSQSFLHACYVLKQFLFMVTVCENIEAPSFWHSVELRGEILSSGRHIKSENRDGSICAGADFLHVCYVLKQFLFMVTVFQ